MSTSQELPDVSTWLNDMPRTTACASAIPSAPDWLTMPIDCLRGGGIGVMSMNVTRISSGAFTTPMQFGPTMRMLVSRAMAARRCCCAMRSCLPVSA